MASNQRVTGTCLAEHPPCDGRPHVGPVQIDDEPAPRPKCPGCGHGAHVRGGCPQCGPPNTELPCMDGPRFMDLIARHNASIRG